MLPHQFLLLGKTKYVSTSNEMTETSGFASELISSLSEFFPVKFIRAVAKRGKPRIPLCVNKVGK